MATYNGHKNRNHWNVALWIGNDEGLYRLALDCMRLAGTKDAAAQAFVETMREGGFSKTPDGAPYSFSAVRAAMVGLS